MQASEQGGVDRAELSKCLGFFFPILLPLESISFLKEEEQNNNSSHFLHATWCRTTEGPLSVVTHLIFVPTL